MFNRAGDDLDANLFVAFEFEGFESGQSSGSVPRRRQDDPFFDCSAGGVQGVFDAGFLSFISLSVAAPTLMTATPPAILARRSWSFSRS